MMAKLKLYRVDADRETGEWMTDTLEAIGEVEAAEHHARQDTDDVHYDTFDHGAASDPDRPTCAIEVHWI